MADDDWKLKAARAYEMDMLGSTHFMDGTYDLMPRVPVAWRMRLADGTFVYGDTSPLVADGDEERMELLYL